MKNSFDFCILGAGIAGLSLADALHEQGYAVTIHEKHTVASGASGTPGGLVNPATGRRATKTWKAEACYSAVRSTLEKVQAVADTPFFRNNGLLRPAVTKKMVRKMRKQFEKTTWPDGWCHWLSEQEVKERHPGITCVEGGLWLPIGLTVNVGAYLQAYANWLRNQGIVINTQSNPDIKQKNGCWILRTDSTECRCDNIVHATGYAALSDTCWHQFPLDGVKGQVAKFQAPKELLSFSHSLSSLGYIARLDDGDTFIQGSTYEHDFDDRQPGPGGENYLRKRMARTLPELAEKAELVDRWAGVRVTTPDKKPLLGSHPEMPNLHLFTALGSKGLMYGKFLANHYADHLANGTPLLKKVDISRYV